MHDWDEGPCWALAPIAEVVRNWFGVEYTVAGMDVLLHREAVFCGEGEIRSARLSTQEL
jgi:hypothetical protein